MAGNKELFDPNFQNEVKFDDLTFSRIEDTKAVVEGLHGTDYKTLYDTNWCRVPKEIIEPIGRDLLTTLSGFTAGGTIRLTAGKGLLGIKLALSMPERIPTHISLMAASGLSIYVDGEHRSTFTFNPDNVSSEVIQNSLRLFKETQQVLIYLPLYNGIKWIEFGVSENMQISEPIPHEDPRPIMFYGSSITQGACASRPSNTYVATVARWLNLPFRSLGFGGNARGDIEIAEYISNIDMRCLVYDYDYNALSPEFLRETHLPFLKLILEKQPDLPVLMISKPNLQPYKPEAQTELRKEIIMETCEICKKEGYNVSFLDGISFFPEEDRDQCTVDNIHPNDLGFYYMSKGVHANLKRILDL